MESVPAHFPRGVEIRGNIIARAGDFSRCSAQFLKTIVGLTEPSEKAIEGVYISVELSVKGKRVFWSVSQLELLLFHGDEDTTHVCVCVSNNNGS